MRKSKILRLDKSGSPVLGQHDLVSTRAHVYRGAFDFASVIGENGSSYMDYIAAFALPLSKNPLNLTPVTGNAAISAPGGYGSSNPGSMAVTGPRPMKITAPTSPTSISHDEAHVERQCRSRSQSLTVTSQLTYGRGGRCYGRAEDCSTCTA